MYAKRVQRIVQPVTKPMLLMLMVNGLFGQQLQR